MDDFREWLSDNLRYFMLGGAILIIVVVLFCGIRACSGSNKGNSGDEQKTTSEDQGNVPSSPISEGESDEKKEDANPMETADADITALIKSYYQALGEKDIATLKTLEDDFTPSDESKVTNLKDYIEGYEVGDVYTKKGMTDDSYVVYACFSYICQGVETKAPALTQFYVYKNSEGNWVINNGALQDSEISAYMEKQLSDSDVSALIKKVQNELDQAQQSDPSLIFDIEETDSEILFKFKYVNSDKVIPLLKPRTSGSQISPFSSKNLPKSNFKIPDDKLTQYKEIVSKIPPEKLLTLSRITHSYLQTLITKKNTWENIKSDMRLKCVKGKEYIYMIGKWDEYLKYLENEIKEM